jgi:hypothetical protein
MGWDNMIMGFFDDVVFRMAGCGGNSPAPRKKPAADATGTWEGTCSSTVFGNNAATLRLVQTGSVLTGTYSSTTGVLGTVVGTVSGNRISFAITVTIPGNGRYTGAGTINTMVTPATMEFTYKGISNALCGGAESVTGSLTSRNQMKSSPYASPARPAHNDAASKG